MNRIIHAASDYMEAKRLQPDLSRAARCVVAFMAPILAVEYWHLPIESAFAAIAAQNIALVDVRGSYPLRLGLLLAMTAILAGSTWIGAATGGNLMGALGAVVVVTLAGGLWRHLSADYGVSLAISSALLFLIALASPPGPASTHGHFLSALLGGLWGVLVQVALWPWRAQHPRRRIVADSWLALSDLMEAMTLDEKRPAAERHRVLAERQSQLRTALDQASTLLTSHPGPRRSYEQQLGELNQAAARLATRFVTFDTSLETLMERADFAALAPSFAPVISSLTNTTRMIALTVVSRQPSHLAACDVRLSRLGNLLQALRDRVLAQTSEAPDSVQLSLVLGQISALLPATQQALRATIDRADERAAFSLELFDLHTWTLRPLAASLNLQGRPDRALMRFIARSLVLQLVGVAVFKYFELPRGYWLPLTMLVVLQPDYGATRLRAGQRVVGTLAGSLVASALLWLPLPPSALLTALAVTIAGFAFWLKRNYAIAVFFITLFVVVITEVSEKITVAFTVERLIATAAGGLLALLAAQLFWPVWERQRFPALLATSLRANRDFARLLGARLAAGGAYDVDVIATKRAVELANGMVFASLQRMSADPTNQQAGIQHAATLANGNQRLARSLTVVAVHLTPGAPLDRPELARFIALATDTLDRLALHAEAPRFDAVEVAALRSALDQLALPPPSTAATPIEHGVYRQFARCATELSAMLLVAAPA